jgi:predicted adenylyl cyclase CyaB
MRTNLELKAACPSLCAAGKIARKIGAKRIEVLRQVDTYYRVKSGRFKLREINGLQSELIYYERSNRKGSRYSKYVVVPLSSTDSVKRLFEMIFDEVAVVKKIRTLYLYRNTRIHLDRVKGLGSFIEFEVLMKRGKRQAQAMMLFLRREFGIERDSIVAGSYRDLIWKK